MGYEVIRMNADTWRVEDNGVRFFVLAGAERALLVDSGMTVQNARDIAEELTGLPAALLNTHADGDHIGSNGQFERFYMHPDEEAVYRRSGKPGTIVPVREGDVVDLGGRALTVVGLPGHTPGSIAVLERARRVLISGDPIQRHGRIYMFGGHRDMAAYVQSLARLERRTDEFDEIWPSHGDIPVDPGTVRLLREGAEAILAGDVPGTPEEAHGHRITAYDLGFCTLLCDP